MRSRGTPSQRVISPAENSDTVRTRAARRADALVSQRRRRPSRTVNHSGWAKNDTSCTTRTTGQVRRSGAV